MIRMMVIAGACAAVFAGATGMAQSLYKCTDPQGHNSYQSESCSGHQQQAWTRDMPVASPSSRSLPVAAEAISAKRKTPASLNRTVRSGGRKSSRPGNGGAVISLHSDPAACEKAKERRRKTYEKAGLKRNFETSRKMDDLVHQACR